MTGQPEQHAAGVENDHAVVHMPPQCLNNDATAAGCDAVGESRNGRLFAVHPAQGAETLAHDCIRGHMGFQCRHERLRRIKAKQEARAVEAMGDAHQRVHAVVDQQSIACVQLDGGQESLHGPARGERQRLARFAFAGGGIRCFAKACFTIHASTAGRTRGRTSVETSAGTTDGHTARWCIPCSSRTSLKLR